MINDVADMAALLTHETVGCNLCNMAQPIKNIAGQRFGRLVVIQQDGRDLNGNVMWRCRCDCGNSPIVRGSHLRGGQVASCGGRGTGCARAVAEDLTSRQFGQLTVQSKNVDGSWVCNCSCGKTVSVRRRNLVTGDTQSCGCLHSAVTRKRSTKHGLHGTPQYNLFHKAKRRAQANGLPFNIELVDVVIPKKCPLLGLEIKQGGGPLSPNSASLDRITPRLGYVKGNVWVISQKANQMKSDLDLPQLRHFVAVIAAHLKKQEKKQRPLH